MKSEFVATASHELRTPIHSMLLAISGLLAGYSGEITDEVREDLKMVEGEIARLTRLVNDLLDLARIEARKLQLNIGTTSASDIVDTAVDEVSDLAAAHSHQILKRTAKDLPLLRADKDRMVQVMLNLLSNSIKYSPDGGTIIVKAEAADDEVIFSVADNGYGIPSWARQKVFEKFFQADSVMSYKVGGSGLGLTISRDIVRMHGGYIQCESPLPKDGFPDMPVGGERKGTVFVVRVPSNPNYGEIET